MTLPRWLLIPYIEMLPALEAQASIRRTQEHGIGSGAMDKQGRQAILNAWNRQAGGPRRRRAKRLTMEQRIGMARAIGIGVEVVVKKH